MSNGSWKRVLRKRFRIRVLAVYGEACQLAGEGCVGRIQAHHIDENVQNGDACNGIPLCQRHHATIHTQEAKRW